MAINPETKAGEEQQKNEKSEGNGQEAKNREEAELQAKVQKRTGERKMGQEIRSRADEILEQADNEPDLFVEQQKRAAGMAGAPPSEKALPGREFIYEYSKRDDEFSKLNPNDARKVNGRAEDKYAGQNAYDGLVDFARKHPDRAASYSLEYSNTGPDKQAAEALALGLAMNAEEKKGKSPDVKELKKQIQSEESVQDREMARMVKRSRRKEATATDSEREAVNKEEAALAQEKDPKKKKEKYRDFATRNLYRAMKKSKEAVAYGGSKDLDAAVGRELEGIAKGEPVSEKRASDIEQDVVDDNNRRYMEMQRKEGIKRATAEAQRIAAEDVKKKAEAAAAQAPKGGEAPKQVPAPKKSWLSRLIGR